MLLSMFGTQSKLSISFARILEVIARNTLGETVAVHAAAIEQLREAWSAMPASARQAVVLYSDCPQPSLTKLLIDTGAAIVVCIDDFAAVVGFQMINTGKDFVASVRMSTLTFTAIEPLLQTRNLLTITAAKYDAPLEEIISELTDFYNIKINPEQFDAILDRLSHGTGRNATLADFIAAEFPEWRPVETALAALTGSDRKLVENLAQQYSAIAEGRVFDEVYWPRSFFQYGDVPDRSMDGSILLTGPARIVFFGPYLHVPPGAWNAEVQIEVTDCRMDTIAYADIFNGEVVLSAVSMRFPRRGVYAFDIPFETSNPHRPIEIRMHLLKGAIEGELLLHGARITRTLSNMSPIAAQIAMTSAAG
jgi:hypothetical protein